MIMLLYFIKFIDYLPTTSGQRQIIRQPSSPQLINNVDQQQTFLAPQSIVSPQMPQITAKDIGRSSSLPVNATFASAFSTHKEESYTVPKHSRGGRPRQRSNSINLQQAANQMLSGLQTANSEPMLNAQNSALLVQLLSTNTNSLFTKRSSSSTAINSQVQQNKIGPSQSISQPQQQKQQPKHQLQYPPMPLPQKSFTFPAPSVQNHMHHQSASTGMPTSVLASLKKSYQQQGSPGFSTSTTSQSISTPSLSPDSALDIDMPMSPRSRQTSTSSLKYTGSSLSKEPNRRAGHIHAEQKRRYNIKNGFDMLHSLIPELQQNPNAKLSKAAMLQKGAEYIRQLRTERATLAEKMEVIRNDIDRLNNSLSHLQTVLPADGAPVSKQRSSRMSELYEQYIRYRTNENWKYWVFGLIFEPMMLSFNSTVSVASMDDLIRSTYNWVDQHCSLIELRPAVSNKLRMLSMTTDLLADPPTSLQHEVRKAMSSSSSCSSSSSSSHRSKS